MSHCLKIHNKTFYKSILFLLCLYPVFLLTAYNKIKIHRGNEIKERYKIFENKAELESFWNDENIIKRSKFPREKDPTTQ